MPESPLLFSSAVPTSGSCFQLQSRIRGVKESRSGKPEPTATVQRGAQAGRWRRDRQRLDSSTCRLQNRGNKARMSMKTKEEDRTAWGLAQTLALNVCDAPKGAGRSGCAVNLDLSLRDIADPRHQGSVPSVDSRTGGTKRECLWKQRIGLRINHLWPHVIQGGEYLG